MAIEAEVGLLKQPQLHRLVSEVLHKILIGTIERLAPEFVLGLRRLFRPIDLLDQVTLRTGNRLNRFIRLNRLRD